MGRALGVVVMVMTSALAISVVACSGSDSPSMNAPAEAGTTTSEGGPGEGDGGAKTVYTLDNVCALTGPRTCALRKSCCEETGGYDEAKCLEREQRDCEASVAQVRAGTMSFKPDIIEGCYASLAPLFTKCVTDLALFAELVPKLNDCRVFEGKLGEGLACERDDQCKVAPDDSSATACSEDTKKCVTTTFLAKGAACSFGEGAHALCGTGLYCDVPLDGGPLEGTCKQALAVGADCQLLRPLDCGLGAYCDASTKKCTPSKAGAASCANNLQCLSTKCTNAGDAGLGACEPQKPVASAKSCGKGA